MTSDIISTLKDCPDLKDFTTTELEELSGISKLVHFEKGHDVFSIEHGDNYLFIVADGMLTLQLFNNQSKKYHDRDLFGEIILFNDRGRLGTIKCLEETTLLALDKRGILESNDKVSLATRFKFIQCMGKKMAGYFYTNTHRNTEDLVLELESEYLEFKPSMAAKNWNGIIRTISGFMNLNGGTVLCGIKDGGGEYTYFKPTRNQIDFFELKLRELMFLHLGNYLPKVIFNWESIGKHQIVRIDVKPSTFPVFYKDFDKNGKAKELFYIRSGNRNHPILLTSDIVDYVQKRFKKGTLQPVEDQESTSKNI